MVRSTYFGFGKSQIKDAAEAEQAVKDAIEAGYRHIDITQSYMNEEAVSLGIAASCVDHKELFITTKIWVGNVSYKGVKGSFERSLKRLGMDYIDLLLIHQPFNGFYGAWVAMEELQAFGKIRAIGVSNFSPDRVIDLAAFNDVTPQVNQIEVNPLQQQTENLAVLRKEGVAVEAWAPVAEGKNDIFNNPVLTKIGAKYEKSAAQVILRWLVEQDIIVLAKSVK